MAASGRITSTRRAPSPRAGVFVPPTTTPITTPATTFRPPRPTIRLERVASPSWDYPAVDPLILVRSSPERRRTGHYDVARRPARPAASARLRDIMPSWASTSSPRRTRPRWPAPGASRLHEPARSSWPEVFTGRPGVYVPDRDTVASLRRSRGPDRRPPGAGRSSWGDDDDVRANPCGWPAGDASMPIPM